VFNASVLTLNDEPGPANESNQPLTVASVSGTSSNGGVVALTSGVISYTPPLDYNGIDTFTYTVRDNGLTSGSSDVQTTTGTVTMIVTAVNDTPTATSDTATTAEDQPLVITGSSLAINDARGPSNESGQNLTITAVGASAQGGTVTLNAATGEIAYNPKQDFNGNDTFTYTIRDDGLTNGVLEPKTATATVTVTVTPVNDAPVAVTDQHTIPEDNALVLGASVLLGNDLRGPADPTIDQEETQTLMITDVSQDSSEGGTVTLIGSTLTYTPPADFNGLDTFTYTIVDNGRTGNDPDPKGASGTVSVTVSEVNDAPILRGAVATMFEDDTLILTPSELFLDDSAGPPDEAGVQTLAATSVSGTSERGGTVTLVNTINGMTVAYVPPANFNGLDTFVYTAVDNGETNGTLDPRSSTGTYTIDITPQNDAPTAVSDAFAGNEDAILQVAGEGVLGNDFDIDVPKDVLTVVNPGQITTDLGATVTIASDGTFSYDPTSSAALQSLADGQSDLDRFRYTVGDGTTTSNEATVRISVSGRNDAPVALDDTGFTVDEDSQLSVATSNSILLNDTDAEEPEVGAPMIGSLRAVRVSGPGNGSLNLNANGTFTYTPNPDFNGIDTFVYRANDGLTNSNPATVSITVAPGNDAPVAGGDVYSVNQDTTLAVNATDGVLRNDSDPDQLFPLTVELVNDPFNGDLQLSSSDGSFTYSPNASFVGTDTFTYRAIDSEGLRSLDTTVVINVLDTNPFQNPRNPLDVNNDGFVSPIDALLLTNEINANGSHALTTALANVPFPDTNGDGTISPIDVVQVINFLNNNSGLPEGESSAPAGLVRVAADVAPPTSAVFGHNVVGQPESPITQVSPDGAPIADEHQEFFGSLGDQEQAASDEQAIRASEDVADVKEDDFADALEELFGSSFDDLM
jgi:VCBS repeat-containing protein